MPCRTKCLHFALTTMPGGLNLSKRVVKGVGRSPHMAQSGVGDGLCRGRRPVPVQSSGRGAGPHLTPFLHPGAVSLQVEERDPEAQQSVSDPDGVQLNQLFVPKDNVAVPSVQTDMRQCRRVGPPSALNGRVKRHRIPAPSYQPGQKGWLGLLRWIVVSDQFPCLNLRLLPVLRMGGSAYMVWRADIQVSSSWLT